MEVWYTNSNCCFYLQGQLYAVGGNDGSASLDSCERYDPHLDTWTKLANMNKRRAGAGCAELGGMLYVVGKTLEWLLYCEKNILDVKFYMSS